MGGPEASRKELGRRRGSTIAIVGATVLLLTACQSTVGEPGATGRAAGADLTVPPPARNHARTGDVPVSPVALRDDFFAANSTSDWMVVIGTPGQTGFALSRDGRIDATYRVRGANLGAEAPIGYASGNRVCNSVAPEDDSRWRGTCWYTYRRADGSIRVVQEGGRAQQVRADFTGPITGA